MSAARRAPIVAICMPERGHVQRLLALVAGLARRGRVVHVLTDLRFAADVAAAGGRFVDLFADCPLAAADALSRPVPVRYVSFAGFCADAVTARVAALAPALVLYDTFAVVAPLVARRLRVPWVNVCAGHAGVPERLLAALRRDPRVAVSAACRAAVALLRDQHGMPEAHPFSYVEGLSPHLNVYGEPPEFLDAAERAALEPLAFFGSLGARATASRAGRSAAGRAPGRRVYVSFGTVIWRYFEAEACAALAVLVDVLAPLASELIVSLGDHRLDRARRAALARPGVRVLPFVDQWAVLAAADAFVTHHGLNSTHEAIFHEVPMLSVPFFWDQPALARRCADFGLAVPLVDQAATPPEPARVRAAFARLTAEHASFAARLATARAWELATIAGRDAVLDRILALG